MSITIEDILRAARELEKEQTPVGPAYGGIGPQDVCPAGEHDMDTHGRQIWKNGRKNGRYCIGCKRKRQRTPGAAPRPNAQKPRNQKEN